MYISSINWQRSSDAEKPHSYIFDVPEHADYLFGSRTNSLQTICTVAGQIVRVILKRSSKAVDVDGSC